MLQTVGGAFLGVMTGNTSSYTHSVDLRPFSLAVVLHPTKLSFRFLVRCKVHGILQRYIHQLKNKYRSW